MQEREEGDESRTDTYWNYTVETIEKLTRELAEETNQKSKLVKEHEKELQRISREHDSEIKQLQKQGVRIYNI